MLISSSPMYEYMSHCRRRTNIQSPKWISSFAYEHQNLFSVPEKKKRLTHSILDSQRSYFTKSNELWLFECRKRMLVRGFDGICGTTTRIEYWMEWKYFWAMVARIGNNIIQWKSFCENRLDKVDVSFTVWTSSTEICLNRKLFAPFTNCYFFLLVCDVR